MNARIWVVPLLRIELLFAVQFYFYYEIISLPSQPSLVSVTSQVPPLLFGNNKKELKEKSNLLCVFDCRVWIIFLLLFFLILKYQNYNKKNTKKIAI